MVHKPVNSECYRQRLAYIQSENQVLSDSLLRNVYAVYTINPIKRTPHRIASGAIHPIWCYRYKE